jgi:two-component system NtrC family sensor kinase
VTPGAHVRFSLSLKLAVSLVLSLAAFFTLLGFLNLRLQRLHSEELVRHSAERASDIILRSTRFQMLRNDRDALYQVITTIGNEPGIRRVRIFNEEGRISFSTDASEVNTFVDKRAEACYACHAQEQPLTKLDRPDRTRIFTEPGGQRVMGVIRPIENEPSCSNAACHAHPPERRILGVIDADLSLITVDQQLAEQQKQLVRFTALGLLMISLVSVVFVVFVVHRPVRELTVGTQRLAQGNLEHRLAVRSSDELGDLAASFNTMAADLARARDELTSWNRTLEERVEQKTGELKRAHEHVLQVEKMASIGKLAAIVAHEINNPLSGILTYTKLMKKWLVQSPWDEARREEVRSSLELIESESRRCSEIVKNLLTFARARPMNIEKSRLNALVERCVKLVGHQLALSNIQLSLELDCDLPVVQCDPSQIEQVFLALMMNAIDALPRGGNLWVRTRPAAAPNHSVEVQIQDDGVGIAPDVVPHLFEPFFTTKERGHGVGLGLAISKGIIERHHGTIDVQSEHGRGTTFTILLPVSRLPAPPAGASEFPTQAVKAR